MSVDRYNPPYDDFDGFHSDDNQGFFNNISDDEINFSLGFNLSGDNFFDLNDASAPVTVPAQTPQLQFEPVEMSTHNPYASELFGEIDSPFIKPEHTYNYDDVLEDFPLPVMQTEPEKIDVEKFEETSDFGQADDLDHTPSKHKPQASNPKKRKLEAEDVIEPVKELTPLERRTISNRISAQESRLRKKQRVAEIEANVAELEKNNQELRVQKAAYEKANRALRQQVAEMKAEIGKLAKPVLVEKPTLIEMPATDSSQAPYTQVNIYNSLVNLTFSPPVSPTKPHKKAGQTAIHTKRKGAGNASS